MKVIVISDIESAGALGLVLDKVLGTNECPLKDVHIGIVSAEGNPIQDLIEALRRRTEESPEPPDTNKKEGKK
jgi:hypothetical protein